MNLFCCLYNEGSLINACRWVISDLGLKTILEHYINFYALGKSGTPKYTKWVT
jgi:hypothetical protein